MADPGGIQGEGKSYFQSSFMLTTAQPFFFA